jgi:hypothetical protein
VTERRAGGAPRPRGSGRGRRDRRAIARGGEGIAGLLNRAVAEWDGARITPMFGRWGYFVGGDLFGCYPIRPKDHDLWIRLPPADQARALGSAGVRPHRRFAGRGWIECDVSEPEEVARGLRWLRRGWAALRRGGASEGPGAGEAGASPAPWPARPPSAGPGGPPRPPAARAGRPPPGA